jgi:hypothetical protein
VIVWGIIFVTVMVFLKARTKCWRMKYCRDIISNQEHGGMNEWYMVLLKLSGFKKGI